MKRLIEPLKKVSGKVLTHQIDVVGVNWDVDIMVIAGSSGSTSVISRAYGYVLDQKTRWLESDGEFGANVVSTNSSFGVDFANCNSGSYPIWNDLYNAMGAVGILSVAATINGNYDIDLIGDVPTGCDSDYIIAVTNTTRNDMKNNQAGYGEEMIDLGAPGTDICSTAPGNEVICYMTGTSMATPHVAGAIALIHAGANQLLAQWWLDNPALGALEIKQIILENVDPLDSLQGITVSGGRLNLYNAVQSLECPNTLGDVNNDGSVNVIDIVSIVNVILGETLGQCATLAADINEDEVLDVLDIIVIVNLILDDGREGDMDSIDL